MPHTKKITMEAIRSHNPCVTGWKQLTGALGRKTGTVTFSQILESNGIKDAVWCLRVLPYREQCLFRADVAELVVHLSDDPRVQAAIDAIRVWYAGDITDTELAAVYVAAYTAANAAANAAADAAYAAANAAYAAAAVYVAYAAAAYDAAYGAAYDAAYGAAYAAAYAADADANVAAYAADAAAAYATWGDIETIFRRYYL